MGGEGSDRATLFSAASSGSGKRRPRRDARARIPRHAFGLKKYLGRCSPVVSKTSDNDDATASLGDSEVLSVQHSVCEPIPAFCQAPEDGTHDSAMPRDAFTPAGATRDGVGVSETLSSKVAFDTGSVTGAGAGRRQEARDVFEDDPSGAELTHDAVELPIEARPCAFTQAATSTCHGEVLAGESARENSASGVESKFTEGIACDLSYVVEDVCSGVAVGEHAAGMPVDLREHRRVDPGTLERDIDAADARERRHVLQVVVHRAPPRRASARRMTPGM